MIKAEIEEKLKEKYDDEYTIKMFTNFVLEFQECFSEVMQPEEVIDRIKANVFGNIKIVDEFPNKNLDGRYSDDGHVYLKKTSIEDEEYVKYLLFHEMLHALTSVRDENGTEISMGFSYLKNCLGMGLNEGMTEYLTQIRNEKFCPNRSDLISGYRIIVEQIRRLILIVGDKELIKSYFYNAEELKDIFSANNIDYTEIELAFRALAGKDADANLMMNGKTLQNNENYKIHRFSETIFTNYSRAIGEVNSLEDFERKYRVFQTYKDGQYDSIGTMFLTYYKNMGQDIDELLRKRIPLDDIKKVLGTLNLNINNVAVWYNFSKTLVEDKNQSAINLYEYYCKNPQNYFGIFAQSYATIYDHFSEYDDNPGNDRLYDDYKYAMIGRLLKEHPEIDYSEVSYDLMEEKTSKTMMYIFSSSNGKKYAYTTRGEKCKEIIEQDGSQSFEFTVNEKCKGRLIYTKDGSLRYSFKAGNDFDMKGFMENIDFSVKQNYSDKENLEYWIQESADHDGNYSKILNKINKRIQSRREVDFFDV